MTILTFYDTATGRYLHQREGSLIDILRDIDPAHGLVEGAYDGETHYLLAGSHTARPALGPLPVGLVADGADLWACDVPEGTLASIIWLRHADGVPVPAGHPDRVLLSDAVSDGRLEWSTSFAGRYRVTLVPPFPWRRVQFEVEATVPGGGA